MATISITHLVPTELPPADKSIRAVVTLLWPYSSSTKQCALLLADPDFRLRNRKGQVRVRFANGSAEAIARGKVGIGDEVILQLRGASWAGQTGNVNTPGRSVDGELVFRGELGLVVVKKATGEGVDLRINVNESTPPPDEERQEVETQRQDGRVMDSMATPARATPRYVTSNLGGADVVPIYSSPAFIKRLRLSEESKSRNWDPFADGEEELEQQPRKKQRISFGTVEKWRFADRSPSPEDEDEQLKGARLRAYISPSDVRDLAANHQRDLAQIPNLSSALSTTVDVEPRAKPSTMLPPPLPKLVMPDEKILLDSMTTSKSGGPSTPKLQPVPSSALPLPSPFPVESSQLLFSGVHRDSQAVASQGLPNIEPATVTDQHPASEQGLGFQMSLQGERRIANGSERWKEGITIEKVAENNTQEESPQTRRRQRELQLGYRDQHYSSQLSPSRVENLSDTEEDEEMYINHMRRRFPTFDERGYRRVDHQEEGYYDDLSDEEIGFRGNRVSVENPTQREQEPDSGAEAGDEDETDELEHESSLAGTNAGQVHNDLLETIGADVTDLLANRAESAAAALPEAKPVTFPSLELDKSEQQNSASQAHISQSRSSPEAPSTPSLRLSGFNGALDPSTVQTSTPQSEHDRIMKRTYSSLFGFSTSPSPERQKPEPHHLQTPTPAPTNPLTLGEWPVADSKLSLAAPQSLSSAGPSNTTLERTAQQSSPGKAEGSQHVLTQDSSQLPQSVALVVSNGESGSANGQGMELSDLQRQAVQTTTETSQTQQVSDVEDYSLSTAMRATESHHEATANHPEHIRSPNTPPFGDSDRYAAEYSDTEVASDDELMNDSLTAARESLLSREGEERRGPSSFVDESSQDIAVQDSSDGEDAEMEDAPAFEQTSTPVCSGALLEDGLQTSQDQQPLMPEISVEDSVADGVAFNEALDQSAANHAEKPHESYADSLTAAPRSSGLVEVIELDSSDEEVGPAPTPAPILPTTEREVLQPPHTQGIHDIPADTPADLSQVLFSQTSQTRASSALDSKKTFDMPTQGSSKSVPDMLDTTQTTIDRSEIQTPVAQDADIMVPDTLEENGLWTQPGHQGFFTEQLHATEVPGTQMPLNRNPPGPFDNIYNYSFQSATSVATVTSEDRDTDPPPAAPEAMEVDEEAPVQRPVSTDDDPARHQVLDSPINLLSSPTSALAHLHDREVDEQGSTVVTVDVSGYLASQVTAIRQTPPSDEASQEIGSSQLDPTSDSERNQNEQSYIAKTPSVLVERAAADAVVDVEPIDRVAARFDDQWHVGASVESGGTLSMPQDLQPLHQQLSHPALPISPEDSQHRLESSPFETQPPSSVLPPTPQLTQGDSLLQSQPETIFEDVDSKDATQAEANTVRPEKPADKVLKPPKTPVRRSARKSQAALIHSPEPAEQSQQTQVDIDAPARRTRSKSTAVDAPALPDLDGKTLVKKSSKQVQVDADSTVKSDDMLRGTTEDSKRPATPELASGAASQDTLLSSTKRMSVRRAPRRSRPDIELLEKTEATEWDADIQANDTLRRAHRRTRSASTTADAVSAADMNVPQEDTGLRMEAPVSSASSKKTPGSKKSLTTRLGNVPDVISNWFSPRRSTKHGPVKADETAAQRDDDQEMAPVKRAPSNGFSTQLSYYTPLSNLEQKLNPSSQSSLENAVEVLAVVTDKTSAPERAKGGPRNYFTVFKITDPSLSENESVRVEVYRPWHAKLPLADVGDNVLLRSFAVKSRKRQPYLLSTDSSAWCVWRYPADEPSQTASQTSPTKGKGKGKAKQSAEGKKPAWAQRNTRQRATSVSSTTGMREEVKGPPVELGDEERERAAELRTWWVDSLNSGTRAPDAAIAARTRSGRV